jgi:hypothetical protein
MKYRLGWLERLIAMKYRRGLIAVASDRVAWIYRPATG